MGGVHAVGLGLRPLRELHRVPGQRGRVAVVPLMAVPVVTVGIRVPSATVRILAVRFTAAVRPLHESCPLSRPADAAARMDRARRAETVTPPPQLMPRQPLHHRVSALGRLHVERPQFPVRRSEGAPCRGSAITPP